MGWTTTTDQARFLRAAEDFLQSRPVANSVLRTVSSAVRRRGPAEYGPQPPVFGWWRPVADGAVAAAYLRTPPYPPLSSGGPAAAARELAQQWTGEPPAQVRGDHEATIAFADAWCARTGAGQHEPNASASTRSAN